MYRSSFIAILICAFCGIFCFGAEPSSDLPNETVDSPADGQKGGEFTESSEDAGLSGQTEGPAEEIAEKEAPTAAEDATSAGDAEPEVWVDQFRNVFKSQLDRSADWVDGLMAAEDFQGEAENTYGRVAANVYWQNREGFYVRGRFRVKVNLDSVNHRFNAIIGKGDPTDLMADRFEDTSRFASFYQGGESDELLAGIGYTPDWAKKNSSFSIGGGVHVTWPPAPYVNLNYRGRYLTQNEEMMVNFYQKKFQTS